MNLVNTIGRSISQAKINVKARSPEILIAAGLVGFAASIVAACRATVKANDILEPAKERIKRINLKPEDGIPYEITDEEIHELDDTEKAKETTKVMVKTGFELAKAYLPSIIIFVASSACVLTSNRIMRERAAVLAASVAALDNAFSKYRKGVIERFGEGLDDELRFGLKAAQIEEVTVDENGEEKRVKKDIEVAENIEDNPYILVFDDDNCAHYESSYIYNLSIIKSVLQWANDELRRSKILTINQVRAEFGAPPIEEGVIAGWVYDDYDDDPVGDNYVTFRTKEVWVKNKIPQDGAPEYKKVFILDMNAEPNIYRVLMDRKKNRLTKKGRN